MIGEEGYSSFDVSLGFKCEFTVVYIKYAEEIKECARCEGVVFHWLLPLSEKYDFLQCTYKKSS